jgi:hypothetical protein
MTLEIRTQHSLKKRMSAMKLSQEVQVKQG